MATTPDFIVYTTKGTLILIETKGNHLDKDKSREKNELGSKFKYFMVFESQSVPDAYTQDSILGL